MLYSYFWDSLLLNFQVPNYLWEKYFNWHSLYLVYLEELCKWFPIVSRYLNVRHSLYFTCKWAYQKSKEKYFQKLALPELHNKIHNIFQLTTGGFGATGEMGADFTLPLGLGIRNFFFGDCGADFTNFLFEYIFSHKLRRICFSHFF